MGWRSRRTYDADLAAECEAYVNGEYAELVAGHGRAVPAWAWMNLLAHGTEQSLGEAASQIGSVDGWRQGRALLAAEVLDLVERRGISLAELQSEVIVPSEQAALAAGPCDAGTTGQQMAALSARLTKRAVQKRR